MKNYNWYLKIMISNGGGYKVRYEEITIEAKDIVETIHKSINEIKKLNLSYGYNKNQILNARIYNDKFKYCTEIHEHDIWK